MTNFDNLTEEERKVALKILKEMSQGQSKTYDNLLYSDYNEIPVDIETFITDDRYLGQSWKNTEGKLLMYPFWMERLKELFPDNLSTSANNVILTGARGIGKSEIMVTIGLYLMYRLMCLKDPHQSLHLKPSETVAFAFVNITQKLAEDIGVSKFQKTVRVSPWFLKHGNMVGIGTKHWEPPEWINIIIGSESSHVIGQCLYFCGMDEINFIKRMDVQRQKEIAIDIMDTALGGMQTRFIYHGKNPTVMCLASSKKGEKAFLEEHMKQKIAEGGQNAIIVDKAVWEVKPPETYSGKRFNVAVGNKFLASEIIPEGVNPDEYLMRGYTTISVPIEFEENFRNGIDRALCDYAGVASSNLTKYISGIRVVDTTDDRLQNPFTKDTIQVGDAKDDTIQYKDFFDMSRVPQELMGKPLFIHLDMSISGDKTGIAGVWITGKKASAENSAKELSFQMAFGVAIEAPKGHQVSFAKNREFIYWLKEQGFRIRGISSDTFQNAAIAQDFVSKGYDYKVISVDKVDTKENICVPYAFLKNCIYEKRITLLQSKLLMEELVGLERDGNNGRINHPNQGKTGSKDLCDSVCGATYNASQHAEEYAYDFGENLDTALTLNTEIDRREQMTVDFEEELKQAFQQRSFVLNQNIQQQQPVSPIYIADGIGVW